MDETGSAEFLNLVEARRGHFRLESGHHSALWLDLDSLFSDPNRLTPFAERLTAALRPHAVDAVCGPLLGGAFLAQLVAHALGAQFYFTEGVVPADADGLYQVRYRLPPALGVRVRGKRVAIVDDAMSAGSAVRGTYEEIEAHGATPVVIGALLILGSTGIAYFDQRHVPIEAVARMSYELWLPNDCPLCAKSIPIDDVVGMGTDLLHRVTI